MVPHIGLLLDPVCKEHHPGAGHPERPERYDAVAQGPGRAGLIEEALTIAPRAAADDEIGYCQTRDYIRVARRLSEYYIQ